MTIIEVNGTTIEADFESPPTIDVAIENEALEVLIGEPGVLSDSLTTIVALSQAEYDLLSPPDPLTLYLIIN